MRASPESGEVKRLKKVYEAYSHKAAIRHRWRLDNPGNQAIACERRIATFEVLKKNGYLPLTAVKVLDVGCGSGTELARLAEWGALHQNLYGIDLIPERIEAANRNYLDLNFQCINAECLPWPDGTFDLVMLFTVFSSMLDDSMAFNVAREVTRVLKSGGAVVWYDMRYRNPYNRNVHGITRRRLHQLFPSFRFELRSITLLPPLARRLGKLIPLLYPLLVRIPSLRTHYLGLLTKP
ncbi:MAG: class I SAM-dependent methyltransferase [Betaproteobacteria bacterium]